MVQEALDYLLMRLYLRQLSYGLVTEEPCDVGEFVGRCRSGNSNDAMSGSLDCAVQRTPDLQPRHRLDVLVDRSEL